MSEVFVESGLIQSVTPFTRNELYQMDGDGTESKSENIKLANKDSASPQALPAIPTTEAPYDGNVCFGVFVSDESLDGITT